jgi:DNA repair exonuclease SbcCD ATPase subunit
MKLLCNKHIKYIYHLADIHIRPLDRHDEYRYVFDNLYKFLKNEDNIDESFIVICGDIIHEKDKITPELILLLRDFLKNLSNITNTILFSGNHDLIENNLARIPNLEALTQDISDNIHYLKHTGLYEIGNVIFSLNSLEDTNSPISIPKDINKIKIGLYHGMLKEIAFSNGLLSTEDFKEFDYVLLGDIHERQFLQDNIAYSGSLIQQNFGETTDNHGIIKWDIINHKAECIDIPNEYGYLTIKDISDIDKLIDYPKNCRLRINLTNNDDIPKVQELVKSKTNVISEKIIKFKNIEQKIQYDEEFIKNMNDEIIIKDKIKDTIKDIDDIDNILKLHNDIKKECNFNTKDISEYKWSILNIEFMNLFIYGNDKMNKIDFTQTEGVVGILGNNAIGKSSIINIIIFALFDKITTEYNNTNVINKNSKKMYVKIEFLIGNTIYIIEKTGRLQKSNKSIKTKYETNYMKIEKGVKINLNGKDKIKTKAIIEDTIGFQNIFLLCNIVSNSLSYSLLNIGNTECIKIFSNLFNLDKYDDLYKNISNKIKLLVNESNIQEGKLSAFSNIQITQINKFKTELNNKIESKKEFALELKTHTIDLNEFNNKIINLNKKIIMLEKPSESLENLETERLKLQELIKVKPTETLEDLYLRIDDVEEDNLSELTSELKKYKIPKKNYTEKDLYKKETELKGINNNILRLKKELSDMKDDNNEYASEIDVGIDVDTDVDVDILINELQNEIIPLKEVEEKKKLISKTYDIKKIENSIKEYDDILFYNSNFIAKESKELQKELSDYTFFKDESFKTRETKMFLEKIHSFLSKIKTEEELNNIKKYNNEKKKELDKALKVKKMNDEAMLFNKMIDEAIQFNEESKMQNDSIKKRIYQLKYYKLNNELKINNNKQIETNDIIKEIKDTINYFKLKNTISKIESNLEIKYKIEQLKYQNQLDDITKNIQLCKKYNEHNKENDKLIQERALLNKKIEIVRNHIIECNNNITKLNIEIDYDTTKVSQMEDIFIKRKECKTKLDDITKTLSLYEIYKDLVDKKCIPSILLKEKLKFIENDINFHLDGLVNFKIEMYMDDKSKFILNIIKNDNILKAYMCSGYERFILNIMIKNSLNRYSYNNKSNIFCIDEGLDCIDDNNLKKFKLVLERLQNTYNHILLISQIDRIDKYINHEITIEHKNNYSYII